MKLPATGLCLRELDLVAQTLEHLHGGDPDVGEQRVVHAGEEEGDAHGRRS